MKDLKNCANLSEFQDTGFKHLYQLLNRKQFLLSIFKVFLFLFLLTSNFEVLAQNNAVKALFQTNGFGLDLSYERALSSSTSLQISFLGKSKTERNRGIFKTRPLYSNESRGLFLDYKYYGLWNKRALNGVYLSPNVSFQTNNLTHRKVTGLGSGGFFGNSVVANYATAEKKVSSFGTGIKLGLQKTADEATIDFGVNFLWKHALGNEDSITLDNGDQQALKKDVNGFTVSFNVGAGLAF